MSRQLQELRWGEIGINLLCAHGLTLHQLDSMYQPRLVDSRRRHGGEGCGSVVTASRQVNGA
jgi:hypothetical protein